jgi:hypothetical protein
MTGKKFLSQHRDSRNFASSRAVNGFLLAVAYFLVAAATFNGFYDKWHLRDDNPELYFSMMVDGTASKPYVYRQLIPTLANVLEAALPVETTEKLTDFLYMPDGSLKLKLRSPEALDRAYTLRYHFVYFTTFLFIFFSLFAMRAVCLEFALGAQPSAAAPAAFILCMPYLQTVGGFFYDYSELFFLAAAVLLAVRGWLWALIPLTLIATFNKESFFFFTFTLYPIVSIHRGRREAAIWTIFLSFVAGVIYLLIRLPYLANPGSAFHNHLWDAFRYYFDLSNLFSREITYGLTSFRGLSFISLAAILAIVMKGWPGIPEVLKRHILIAAAINLPMFIVMCFPGEMRNLSFLFVGFVGLIAKAISASTDTAGLRRAGEPC